MTNQSDVIVDKIDPMYKYKSVKGTVGGGSAYIVPTIGEIWEIVGMVASFDVDATVSDRTADLVIETGMELEPGPALQEFPISQLTLSASQEGRIYMMGSGSYVVLNDNGAITQSGTIESVMPLYIYGRDASNGYVGAVISNNNQAGDVERISAIYRKVN